MASAHGPSLAPTLGRSLQKQVCPNRAALEQAAALSNKTLNPLNHRHKLQNNQNTMEPFSISTGVLAFISVSVKILVGLKQFKANFKEASTSINALISDISGLRRVLQAMEETFQGIDDEQAVRETGHIGTHWQNLQECLNDGHEALTDFDAMLLELNRSVKVLDETRRKLRIQSSATRIAMFRQQVRAYRDTLQMSLQAIILCVVVLLHTQPA